MAQLVWSQIPGDFEKWKRERLAKSGESGILNFREIAPITGEKNPIGRTKETAVVYDENGKELFRRYGDVSQVRFTPEEAARLRGKIVSHNHPNNGPLSPPDMYQPWKNGLAEVRAVTAGGIYSMKQPSQWKLSFPSPDKLNAELISIFQARYEQPIQKRMSAGRLTPRDGELLAQRLSMRRLCRKYGVTMEFREW